MDKISGYYIDHSTLEIENTQRRETIQMNTKVVNLNPQVSDAIKHYSTDLLSSLKEFQNVNIREIQHHVLGTTILRITYEFCGDSNDPLQRPVYLQISVWEAKVKKTFFTSYNTIQFVFQENETKDRITHKILYEIDNIVVKSFLALSEKDKAKAVKEFIYTGNSGALKKRSDYITETTTPKSDNDPEFDKKNLILQRFLMIQELPLGEGKPQALFTDEQEKARYIHFVFGAIDLLSRTIKDEKRSELWAMTTSMGRAAVLFGIDEALNHVESFGRTDNKSLEAASKSGWDAMRIFLLGLNDKASKEDTLKNALSLFKAVREQ
jgi:hypothetical protein